MMIRLIMTHFRTQLRVAKITACLKVILSEMKVGFEITLPIYNFTFCVHRIKRATVPGVR